MLRKDSESIVKKSVSSLQTIEAARFSALFIRANSPNEPPGPISATSEKIFTSLSIYDRAYVLPAFASPIVGIITPTSPERTT